MDKDKHGKASSMGREPLAWGCGGVFSKSQRPKALTKLNVGLTVEVSKYGVKKGRRRHGPSIVDFARCPVASLLSVHVIFVLHAAPRAAREALLPLPR